MSLLGRIHEVGVTAIAVGYALLRIALGLLLIGGCAWVWVDGFSFPGLDLILGIFCIWGLGNMVLALGAFGPPTPDPERSARREIRKALRRARMTRR